MHPWWLDVVMCPSCAGRLRARDPMLACARCHALYPVLAGAPVLVPDPAGWMAAHRDAVLATLAERGAVTRQTRQVIDGFVEAAGPVTSRGFSDDWTGGQADESDPPDEELAAWMRQAGTRGPDEQIMKRLPQKTARVIEVGCGDGALTARLANRCQQVIAGDLSLRAVLRAREATARPRRARVAPVVMDAERLPVRPASTDALIAAHVIDVLEDPDAFLAGARAALRPRGRLVASVPDPAGLDALLDRARLRVTERVDALPWLRVHGPRHVQIYFPVLVVARRG